MTPGTKLGRYEIRSKLGVGGMGEVYLADDTELDRQVALKILPANIASDQQRLPRLLEEACRLETEPPERRTHLRDRRSWRYSLHRHGVCRRAVA